MNYPHRVNADGGSPVARRRALRRALPAISCLLSALAIPAAAGAWSTPLTSASQCDTPLTSSPFSPFGDINSYYLMYGGNFTDATAPYWQLSGGAKVISSVLPDGSTGGALYLPAGSQARTPLTCVDLNYRTARVWVKDLGGANGVDTSVLYPATMSSPANSGRMRSVAQDVWTLSDPINTQPARGGAAPGFRLMRFLFTPKGNGMSYELYGLWVDPYARR